MQSFELSQYQEVAKIWAQIFQIETQNMFFSIKSSSILYNIIAKNIVLGHSFPQLHPAAPSII